jgi:death on curing protein
MRYLSLNEVIRIYQQLIKETGGMTGIQDIHKLESAVALPRQTFDKIDLYPTVIEKAAILGFSLIHNHPFIDGNKRVGHAAMEIFLLLNGYEIIANIDEQEEIILKIASGKVDNKVFTEWLRKNVRKH